MKILMLRPQIEIGGVRTVMTTLSLGLLQQGHSVVVGTYNEESPGYFEQRQIPIVHLPLYPSTLGNFARSVQHLKSLVKKQQIDVIYSTHRFTSIIGKLVSKLTDTPLVVSVYEIKQDRRILAPLWTCNTNIVSSQALKDHLVSHYKLKGNTITVIPTGINPSLVADRASSSRLRSEVFQATDWPIVGYIGRLSQEKGVADFIDSIALLNQRQPLAHFVIVGSGPEEQALQQQAHSLNLGDSTLFLGTRQDILELLDIMDIVVIPSLSENFPAVALEAMRAERPVVATTVGGLPEIIRNQLTGLLVPPQSPAQLADAIYTLIQDPKLRKQMGKCGQETVLQEYSTERMIERYIAVFKHGISKLKDA
ncbi:MAG: glycosyltransferase family 4 protein [Caldilineaceae bacterium]